MRELLSERGTTAGSLYRMFREYASGILTVLCQGEEADVCEMWSGAGAGLANRDTVSDVSAGGAH